MAKNPGNTMKLRMLFVVAFMTILCFGVLIWRLFQIQFVDAELYQQKALAQQMRTTTIKANRGKIYDRNGKELARSGTVWTVYLSPADITAEELPGIADGLSEILEVDRQLILDRGANKKSYYQIVKQRIEKETADKVLAFISEHKIKGVNLEEDTKRYYPYGDFAAQLLGFTGSDNQGAYGLEAYYDSVLSGTPGRVVSIKNAKGTDLNMRYQEMYEAQDGNSLVLTIDEVIQHYLEKHLETAVIEHDIKNRAVGIVMDVTNGEILAMATEPDFDPNEPLVLGDPVAQQALSQFTPDSEEYKKFLGQAQFDQWRNKAISDPYEPGSVYKVITVSTALETKSVSLSSSFFCPGYHIVSGVRIGCWRPSPGHGSQNLTEAIQNSCNPAFMMIGSRIGGENTYEFFERFGLSSPTGIDLPGEADNKSLIQTKANLTKPGGVELASTSFGQSFKISPIQLISAIGAAVNGGVLYQPYVVKQVLDPDGNVVSTTQPVAKRQVISKETSALVAQLMESVVKDGSGRNANIPGYRIGGKTGTSQKLDVERLTGRKEHILSFIGIAPADDPKIAVLVLLDTPAQSSFGSVIAAPVVGAVMSEVLPYIGIEPKYTQEELEKLDIEVPNLTGKLPHDAQGELTQRGLKARIVGKGGSVLRQIPAGLQMIPRGGTVILYTDDESMNTRVVVPDVVGMTGQRANQTILNAGLNIRLNGVDIKLAGATAMRQNPEAGTEVEQGTIVTVDFIDTKQEG